MLRIFLELVYSEWMRLREFPVREPYVFEYLGHTSKITLEYVLEYERVKKARLAAEKKAKKEAESDKQENPEDGFIDGEFESLDDI